MLSYAGIVISAVVLGAVVPLSPDEQHRLASSVDGNDERDAAFAALVENVRRWTAGVGDAPIRLHPDFGAMIDNPSAYRGDLCRVRGALQQHNRLPPPHEAIWEWFVRTDSGRPVIVYVVDLDDAARFMDGRTVEVDARFYKRVDARAREGTIRQYAAFVGAFPRAMGATGAASARGAAAERLWLIAAPTGAMLVVFIVLLMLARRREPAKPRVTRGPRANVDQEELPDDPAEALAELKRRAGEGT
jgi:hypothetical protein